MESRKTIFHAGKRPVFPCNILHYKEGKEKTMERFILCIIDNKKRIIDFIAGESDAEIEAYCEKYHGSIALYDTENQTIK